MNVNFTGIQKSPQLKESTTANQQLSFQATHKPDTVSFGNAKALMVIEKPAKGLLTQVIDFIMSKGKVILEFITKLLKSLKGKGKQGAEIVQNSVHKATEMARTAPGKVAEALKKTT